MDNTAIANSEAYITYFTEFKTGHKGIQFPSRNYLELGYEDESRERYVMLLANISYQEYLFYKVDTRVGKTRMGR